MKANLDQYHFVVKNKDGPCPVKIGYRTIISRECKKLLDIKIDQKRNVNELVQSLLKKPRQGISAPSRVVSIVNFEQRQ